MGFYLTKIVVTVVLVVLASEVAKRSSFLGALFASVPLVSVLAIVWLHIDTGSTEKVRTFAGSIFWLVLPSLVLFVSLPFLLKQGLSFYPAMTASILLTIFCYWLMVVVLAHFGIRL
ncbi:MAG: DUF3147 family protein [Desulfuromonadales bacterium]|jgi:hypothetical protein